MVCDLISMYPKLFLVDGEELAREQRMQEVLERYHNSRQIPQTQKPSGDIKVWVHITSKESGNCVGVTVSSAKKNILSTHIMIIVFIDPYTINQIFHSVCGLFMISLQNYYSISFCLNSKRNFIRKRFCTTFCRGL